MVLNCCYVISFGVGFNCVVLTRPVGFEFSGIDLAAGWLMFADFIVHGLVACGVFCIRGLLVVCPMVRVLYFRLIVGFTFSCVVCLFIVVSCLISCFEVWAG